MEKEVTTVKQKYIIDLKKKLINNLSLVIIYD